MNSWFLSVIPRLSNIDTLGENFRPNTNPKCLYLTSWEWNLTINCLSSEPPFPTFKRSVATMNHSIGVVWTPKSLHPRLYRGVIEWCFFYVNNLWLGTDTSLPRAQTWDKRIYFWPPDEPLMYHHHVQSQASHFEKHKNPASLENLVKHN